jgi:hypothetical protein
MKRSESVLFTYMSLLEIHVNWHLDYSRERTGLDTWIGCLSRFKRVGGKVRERRQLADCELKL